MVFIKIFPGLKRNPASIKFHQEEETRNNDFAKNLRQYSAYVLAFFIGPNAIRPITYFLFGLPDTNIWNLTFTVMWVSFKFSHSILKRFNLL